MDERTSFQDPLWFLGGALGKLRRDFGGDIDGAEDLLLTWKNPGFGEFDQDLFFRNSNC